MLLCKAVYNNKDINSKKVKKSELNTTTFAYVQHNATLQIAYVKILSTLELRLCIFLPSLVM